ncbi:GNAT family N-acetyltransferase [Arenibacter sp. H213]|uniref:GNAT family N-acetyltransferase n=1 Tax=Arenibacter antarcticus TaxID=2040469 RepID=A0ABW5VHA6_9FLAO|nr:GNAT family N-acetyltransferase [Arenibacter sp. H213]MCM4169766.1 GNAT family N-acetyltransferase [Arenibacter sp. H213]
MIGTIIREMEITDNEKVAGVIRMVLIELGVPKVGTAYADSSLDRMFQNYDLPRATYFVVEEQGRIVGCAGIAQLENYEGNVCELQKMYFLGEVRGRGIGEKMINSCLKRAVEFGYEHCYLETLPYMKAAQKLYLKTGFDYLEGPMGDTGHYSCNVWMLKSL